MPAKSPPGDNLTGYRAKRRFPQTPEPPGDASPQPDGHPRLDGRFVVHEHHARRLHWDLRLERDGALASWAIPNGIPDDPAHNRKAIHVEDHPLEYIDFSGTIPQGSYGAGEVKVWDTGTYTCEKWRPKEVIAVFDGRRLQGRYALFQAGAEEKDWLIHRMDPPADPDAKEVPGFVPPMLARLSAMPTDESHWAFEIKWDGVRAIARAQPGRFHLFTRTGRDITSTYPELRPLGRSLGSREALLDGEIVAFDDGRPSFHALSKRIHLRSPTAIRRHADTSPVSYMIFDLLWLDGHSLMDLPYIERRRRLASLELGSERWAVPAHHPDGASLLAATAKHGLEGVLAKRLHSPYLPAKRTSEWLKIKNSLRQELVIGGWRDGKGARANQIGALELGLHDDGHLRYAGRVGTGFSDSELDRLAALLSPLSRPDSPFSGPQPTKGARFVDPQLVCEVEFAEWTRDGRLRHPSYQGLRTDKPAAEVTRERIQPSESADRADPPAKMGSAPTAAGGLAALTDRGRRVPGGLEVKVRRRTLKLTNLAKVLYPATGFTKGEAIGWYSEIAPVLVPHLRNRAVTLKRYPDGVEGEHFFEKQSPKHRPDWVKTAAVPTDRGGHPRAGGGREIDYTLCQDPQTLIWLANLAAIELHPSLSLATAPARPTTLAFDLDPGPPADIVACCEVALMLRSLFTELGLHAFAKTSGSKGLQVYVPLNRPSASYEDTKPFAHAVANLLHRRHRSLVVATMAKSKRHGKVLIDWSQNDAHKTTVSVYSLRARTRPTVSTPVLWDEVSACHDARDPAILTFEADQVLDRVHTQGDLFADVLTFKQTLPRLDPDEA